MRPKIVISGVVLSALLYDNFNSPGDQEGFLIGNVKRSAKNDVNDHSISNADEDLLITILSSVPVHERLLYSSKESIKDSDVDLLLGEKKKDVIGWYKFRRHICLEPSLGDITVHRNLRETFLRYNHEVNNCFIFGTLNFRHERSLASHSYDYVFYELNPDYTFAPLGVTVLNLNDTKNQYRTGSMAAAYMESSSFNSVSSMEWTFDSFWEAEDQMQQFHNRLREKLISLSEELAASDAVNEILSDEVAELEKKVQCLSPSGGDKSGICDISKISRGNSSYSIETQSGSSKDTDTNEVEYKKPRIYQNALFEKYFGQAPLTTLVDESWMEKRRKELKPVALTNYLNSGSNTIEKPSSKWKELKTSEKVFLTPPSEEGSSSFSSQQGVDKNGSQENKPVTPAFRAFRIGNIKNSFQKTQFNDKLLSAGFCNANKDERTPLGLIYSSNIVPISPLSEATTVNIVSSSSTATEKLKGNSQQGSSEVAETSQNANCTLEETEKGNKSTVESPQIAASSSSAEVIKNVENM